MSQYQNIGGLFPKRDICANFHGGNEQSVKANEKPNKNAQRTKILALVRKCAATGITCEEAEVLTNLSHQSCSARISELKRDGLIRQIGARATKSGCAAAVYQAA